MNGRLAYLVWLALLLAACGSGDRRSSGELCTNECGFAFDGECDDGAEGAITSVCEYGSDCGDCGPRARLEGPGPGPGPGEVVDAGGGGPSASCDPGEAPYCDDGVAVRCEEQAGVPVRVRENCGGFRCESGECIAECRPIGATDCSAISGMAETCCEPAVCQWTSDDSRHCCISLDDPCSQDSDCCGYDGGAGLYACVGGVCAFSS